GLLGCVLSRVGEVADRSADADERRRPAQPLELGELAAHVLAELAQIRLGGRAAVGEEALGQPHGAELKGAQRIRAAVPDLDELQAASAQLEDRAVAERRAV